MDERVNSVNARPHVATTRFELTFCPSILFTRWMKSMIPSMSGNFLARSKSGEQKGQQTSETRTSREHKVKSVEVRLHVSTTWIELPFAHQFY
jgi:hypothetical protein